MDKKKMPTSTESGITLWNGMYIPIVVAMAARQDVAAALDGGMIAILAGFVAVMASFLVIPLFGRREPAVDDGDEATSPAADAQPHS
ncbi:malonate transporter subunit MadL, partial [Streptomyces sp. P9(2023)]|uniref:malonate transporter subunit MadL n=1 Tax=Streptomyces sp. P9(2023) TaxID=3064394 RepID=UPI0028F4368B